MEKDFLHLIARIIAVIGIGFLLFFLASCYTNKKAYKQVAKADYYHPDIVQAFCHDTTITNVIQGDTGVIAGQQIDCDTVTVYRTINGDGKIVDCPPSYRITDTVYFEDTDKLKAKTAELSQCDQEKNKAEGQRKTLQNALIASAALNLILAVLAGLLIRFKGLL